MVSAVAMVQTEEQGDTASTAPVIQTDNDGNEGQGTHG